MRGPRSLSIAFAACSLFQGAFSLHAQAAPPAAAAAAPVDVGAAPRVASAATSRAPQPGASSAPSAQPAAAAGKADARPALGPEEYTRLLQLALRDLVGSEPGAIQDALSRLKELRGRAAADAIVTRLKQGLPPQLTESALDVLSGLDQPIAGPVLAELTLHRRWQIRAKASAALGALRLRSSVSVLLYALDDPSPEVRSAAARALGLAGDPRAIPALTAALQRGVDGALEGLAQLATHKQVELILARAKTDLRGSEPALWLLLARENVAPVTKLKVIQFVAAHDSEQEAEQVLALWRDKLKSAGDLRLMAALSHTTQPAGEAKAALAPGAQAAVTPSAQAGAKP
jgi:HEAT repeat protein